MIVHSWKLIDDCSQLKAHRWLFKAGSSSMIVHSWKLIDDCSKLKGHRWLFKAESSSRISKKWQKYTISSEFILFINNLLALEKYISIILQFGNVKFNLKNAENYKMRQKINTLPPHFQLPNKKNHMKYATERKG